MNKTLTDTVELIWDLTRERLTIGGALVLRQEGEILAQIRNQKGVSLHIICKDSDRVAAELLAKTVFGSSILPFQLIYSHVGFEGWPALLVRAHPDFSYFSFTRLIALHQESGIEPKLGWSAHQEALAKRARVRFSGRLICVHLRSVTPFTLEESNADGPTWQAFFDKYAEEGVCDFLLIGDDALPAGFTLGRGVTRAVDLGFELATQLALTSIADGFMGMASGLCTAANLSEVPHVIFKHPAHHSDAMAIELGSSDSFLFANRRQQLWRREANSISLDAALDLISS
tara:strand:+ start:1844 stop:2704 length:861 start_codon:yes stop_codon:yes gene_type:complete